MICPVCGFDNLQGDDDCDNCGADLRAARHPAAGQPLRTRGAARSGSISTRCRRAERRRPIVESAADVDGGHRADAGERAPTACSSSRAAGCVGIFTERDAS